MTYNRAELFAQEQLELALTHNEGKVTIYGSDGSDGSDGSFWRDRFFITPARAVGAALALEEQGLVTVKRMPGAAIVRRIAR